MSNINIAKMFEDNEVRHVETGEFIVNAYIDDEYCLDDDTCIDVLSVFFNKDDDEGCHFPLDIMKAEIEPDNVVITLTDIQGEEIQFIVYRPYSYEEIINYK